MKTKINISKIILVAFLFGNKLTEAQTTLPSIQWAKQAGEAEFDYGYGISTDSSGNVYMAGKYEMKANFGGTTWVPNAGNHDIFVAKYGPLGDFKWVRTAGGVWGDYARAASCDAAGNVYITGEIEMDCDFGSGVILYSHGNNDIFLAKYNTNGDLLWAKKLGGGPDSDRGYGITQTKDGVYITGNFQKTSVFNENITINPKGAYDIFVAKYSLDGDFQWIKTAGGTGNDEGWAISSDPQGNVYATGYFSGTANFSGTSIKSAGGADIFVAKYNPAGTLVWVQKAGGSGNDYGRGIAVDKLSRVFVTGGFRSTCYFGSLNVKASGSNDDIFITSYNTAGTPLWARKAGGSSGDIGRAIAVDPLSNVFITGYFGGTATFGNTSVTGIDATEIYFASYDASGNFKWVLKATGGADPSDPGGLQETGLSIATDRWNNVYASGDYRGNSVFGNTTLTAWDHTDIFVTKIGLINTKPKATILTPLAGTLYRAGEVINFSGNGTDTEDGTLPASAFNWKVELRNGTQITSGPPIASGIKNGSFTIPTNVGASGNVFYRLTLVVSDIQGLKDTTFVDINPRVSSLGLVSQPAGLQLLLDGQPYTAPYSVSAVSGMTCALGLTSPQTLNGISYVFDHWSQGGGASQNISVTDSNKTYTASFNANGAGSSCTSSGTITRDYWANFTGNISDLYGNNTPTSTSQLTKFEGPSQDGDYYGSRIKGYICPPVTGNYIFWIASDNKSELWLSTNDQPANKIKIAYADSYTMSREWTKYPSQQSNPISLIEGTKYYIEALHKESTEGDNLAVGWQLPSGVLERPIPGIRLSPYGIPLSTNLNQPVNNTSFNLGSTIPIQALTSGGTGTIQKVEFYAGTTKLGEDLTSPYNFNWSNATTGNYALTSKAIDSGNNTAISSIINISVINPLASAIISPLSNTNFNVGDVIPIQANASGGIGAIKKVEFFADSIKIGEDLTSPYNFLWNNALAGFHVLTSKAIDSLNNSAVSSAITINVNTPNQLITNIISPANNSSFNVGTPINIQAIASGGTGMIQKVEFFADTTKIGESLTSPYNFTWNNASPGLHALKVKATDSISNIAFSSIKNVTINFQNPPTIAITAPTDGLRYSTPANITITADALSSAGNITKVEFYQDTTKIGEDLIAPYSYTWMNVTSGNYILKAKATDNFLQSTASQAVNITVATCTTPVITAMGPLTMCSDSVTLKTNTDAGNLYQWIKNGVNIIGAVNSSYTANSTGNYQVKIIQGSCISWSAPAAVKIQTGLSASITPGGPTTFCDGGDVKLFANTCAGFTYQWKKDNVAIAGETGPVYSATTSGVYQIKITQAGVSAWSSTLAVVVNACRESQTNQNETNQVQTNSDLSGSKNKFQMNIFPNPNTGLFTIALSMPLNKEDKVQMKIVNLIGQVVYNKAYITKDDYFNETVELDKSLPSGIYTLQVIVGNKVENTNMILSR